MSGRSPRLPPRLVAVAVATTLILPALPAAAGQRASKVDERLLAAAKTRLKELEKAVKRVQADVVSAMNAHMRTKDTQEDDAYFREQRAFEAVRAIYRSDMRVLEALPNEERYGRGVGRTAVVEAGRLSEAEGHVQDLESATYLGFKAVEGEQNDSKIKPSATRGVAAAHQARIALEEKRATIDMVLLSTLPKSMPI